jgi:hypothetical protein
MQTKTESPRHVGSSALVRQKLWRVHLRGSGMQRYNPSHVIAPDATAAYEAVRRELDRLEYGFTKDRELLSVELMAEDYEYTETGSRLFLPNVESSPATVGGKEHDGH